MTTFDPELDRQLVELRRLVAGLNGTRPAVDPAEFARIQVAFSELREAFELMAPAAQEVGEALADFGAQFMEAIAEALGPVVADLAAIGRDLVEVLRRDMIRRRLAPWVGWRLAWFLADHWPARFLPELPEVGAMFALKDQIGEDLLPDLED
jgi:hypothetical protein